MNTLILGVDAGNHSAKVVGPFGVDSFKTNICDWFERDVKETFGKDDMEFEIGSRKGFAGTIAQYEDVYGDGTMYGDSKAHPDTQIRILLGINRYLNRYCPHFENVSIFTGQPIKRHNEAEKKIIKDMLEGPHEFIVNGQKKSFTINRVGVAPEGSAAFWCNPTKGKRRVLDIGSGTSNAATIIDMRHINTSSDTYNFGSETVRNKELESIARGIIRSTTSLKWDRGDKIDICGGITEGIAPLISEHYFNAEILKPIISRGGVKTTLHPVFANSVGLYELAKGAFG